MKALVTGGTGFVGSHVVRALLEAGHSARVLHRASSKLDALEGLAYERALGDIGDLDSLRAAMQGCDWVFHVAAIADYWRSDVTEMMQVNVAGTRRVLHAARETGVGRVVFTSSAAAIGRAPEGAPADETVGFNYSPRTFPYGYSKAMAEVYAREAAAAGQDVVIVNPVVVMGPGDLNLISGEFVLNVKRLGWLTPVTGGGVAVTDVRDVARWHLAAAERGISGERYILGTRNVAYPEWFTLIAEVVGAARPGLHLPNAVLPPLAAAIDLLKAVGVPLPIDGNQTRLGGQHIYFSFEKTWETLGVPRIDMRTSLYDTYLWYEQHGYLRPNALQRIQESIARAMGALPPPQASSDPYWPQTG
jgi:dihydroflavonol-4-reductase